MSFSEPHIHEPSATHTHTFIFLHGRGSNGRDYSKDVFDGRTSAGLSLAAHFPSVRWVFPSSNSQWCSLKQRDITEWFNMASLRDPEVQPEGLRDAVPYISSLVVEEAERVGGFGKVVLGGISQGAATAMLSLLCGGQRLGAFLGVSGWLPLADQIEEVMIVTGRRRDGMAEFLRNELGGESVDGGIEAAVATPGFWGHGIDDRKVYVGLGKQACEILQHMGMDIRWRQYEGAAEHGHWIKEPEEFDDIVAFLNQHLDLTRE